MAYNKYMTEKNSFQELFAFAKDRKKYWLIPFIFVLLTVGLLLFVVQGSAISPFVYTLF